jgi:Mg2+/Co2+ transporter CorB
MFEIIIYNNLRNITLSIETHMMAVTIWLTTGCILAMAFMTPNVHWYGRWHPYDSAVHMALTVYSRQPYTLLTDKLETKDF